MNVAAIIVTRGDQHHGVAQIAASMPTDWEVLVWDNGAGKLRVVPGDRGDPWEWQDREVPDLSVYGRYAAIEYTDADLIYVQDDDCVVSDPQAIVSAWQKESIGGKSRTSPWKESLEHVVCNMPPEFRHEFYEDHALVGFGACFHRSVPWTAWGRLTAALGDAGFPTDYAYIPSFLRTCDIAFTALTPRVLVDVPVENLPYAYHYDRMYRQPEHQSERAKVRDLVSQIA